MPFDIQAPTAGLSATAYDRLSRFFAGIDHRPSQDQMAAIRDLLDHLQRAADGELPRALYLSAIPAGTGKTTALTTFAETMMDSPEYAHVGMLVTVNRIAEARDVATALTGYRDRLCVITSDADVSGLGDHATANEAQVCICTQAALKLTLKALGNSPFDAAHRFHFRGERRAVVSWDESFAFNRPVSLGVYAVVGLVAAMQRQSAEAASTLLRWAYDVGTANGVCSVPDFEGLGVDFDLLADTVADRDDLVTYAKALSVVSGDEGFISRHGTDAAIVTHYPVIPASLMPVVVTDASAKVNPSYAQMALKVPVRWLADAPKTYRNMTLRLVNTAASRSVYRDSKDSRGSDLIDMTVRWIESVPAGEAVLVIGYKGQFRLKGGKSRSLIDALKARLKAPDRERLRYLTWGTHTATNDHKNVRHVMLLGLNFVPKSASYAAAGAALDLDLKSEHPNDVQIRETERGGLMDSTLQALLRGNARMGMDGDCGVMTAVIPQTKQTGLSALEYQTMFPGAVLIHDRVLMPAKPLSGRLGELAGIVMRRLNGGDTEMTNLSLQEETGLSRTNFLKLVKKAEWQAFVAGLGLRPQRLIGRVAGLRLVA